MGKIALSMFCSMMIIFMASACGRNSMTTSDVTGNNGASDISEAVSEHTEEISEEMAETINLRMIVGETVITAALDNSETTQAFLATLPQTLTMKRYDDREYYGRIEAISEKGESIPDFENGDVTYYPAGPSFAIFFSGDDRSHQSGLIRIGKITSDLAVFDTMDDSIEMRIELE